MVRVRREFFVTGSVYGTVLWGGIPTYRCPEDDPTQDARWAYMGSEYRAVSFNI